jgi:hypothetical protein
VDRRQAQEWYQKAEIARDSDTAPDPASDLKRPSRR